MTLTAEYKRKVMAEALTDVNRRLRAQGLPELRALPRGLRRNGCECPLMRALGGLDHPTPAMWRFIDLFDAGAIPELDATVTV